MQKSASVLKVTVRDNTASKDLLALALARDDGVSAGDVDEEGHDVLDGLDGVELLEAGRVEVLLELQMAADWSSHQLLRESEHDLVINSHEALDALRKLDDVPEVIDGAGANGWHVASGGDGKWSHRAVESLRKRQPLNE